VKFFGSIAFGQELLTVKRNWGSKSQIQSSD